MGGGYPWNSILDFNIPSEDETVTSDYLTVFGRPYYQLAAWRLHRVIHVDVTAFAGASACGAESNLAQPPDFTHCGRGVVGIDYIYFIAPFVGRAEQTVGRQLRNYAFRGYRVDYFLRHFQSWGFEGFLAETISFWPVAGRDPRH